MRAFYILGVLAILAVFAVSCRPRTSATIAQNRSESLPPVADSSSSASQAENIVVPHGHGTVVYILRRYCGGARPSQEVLDSYRYPVPSSNGTYYILKAQGECATGLTRVNSNELPPRPANAIQVQTDPLGNLILPSPLAPGKYCLVNDLARSCESGFETEYAGSYPACFTVAPGGTMPDSLTIRLTCGTVRRP